MPMPKVEIQEEDLRKLYLEEGLSLQKIGKNLAVPANGLEQNGGIRN